MELIDYDELSCVCCGSPAQPVLIAEGDGAVPARLAGKVVVKSRGDNHWRAWDYRCAACSELGCCDAHTFALEQAS